jgi:hypothetical protein
MPRRVNRVFGRTHPIKARLLFEQKNPAQR